MPASFNASREQTNTSSDAGWSGGRPFVDPTTFLGQTVYVKIDRPLGSRHPEKGFIYSVNYGFVPGQPAPDGDDLDAYVLGVFEPLEDFTGQCIAVVHRVDDDDDKLVLVPEGVTYTDAQIMALVEFQERFFEPTVLSWTPNV
jgi:inorganic pyrophosphatase